MQKTHRSREDIKQFSKFLRRRIKIISHKNIYPFLKQAKKISPDPKDVTYIALALAIDAIIWSNDKRLKKAQTQVPVLTTAEILDLLSSKKLE